MMRRFEILTGMHLGPLQRCVNSSDVIWWDTNTRTLMLNGEVLEEKRSMNFEEAISVLERQAKKYPEKPWAKELAPSDITMSQIRKPKEN